MKNSINETRENRFTGMGDTWLRCCADGYLVEFQGEFNFRKKRIVVGKGVSVGVWRLVRR